MSERRPGGTTLPAVPGRRQARLVSLALGLAVSLLVVALLVLGLLQPLEHVVMSQQLRLRGARPPQGEVAIVAIDSTSVDRLGRWPWPRGCVAAMIDRLAAAGAKVVALDVVFSEPTRPPPGLAVAPDDEALAGALAAAADRMVLGFYFRSRREIAAAAKAGTGAVPAACAAPVLPGDDPVIGGWLTVGGGPYPIKEASEVEANIQPFEDPVRSFGFFDHERDEGVQLRYDAVARLRDPESGRDRYYPALALAAAARFLDVQPTVVQASAGVPRLRLGDRPVPTDDQLRLWIDYAGPEETYPVLPAWTLLAREPDELAPKVAGKLVFFGATETGIGDVVSTPFGVTPGVEVHANVAGNLIAGRYLREGFAQNALSLAALFALGLSVPLLVASARRHLTASLVAIAAVFVWPVVCHAVFRLAGWHLQVVAPMLAGGLALVVSLRYLVGTVERRARRVKGLFSRYVSPEVVEELLRREKVELGGEKRVMTVLFSDIRGFTDMSEHLDSTAVVALLNEFFTPMTRLVLDQGGTLDKYMGDAMMAFFGAPLEQPDHARRACAAALAMREELARLNERWRREGRVGAGGKGLGIGIGLNSGEMTVGNMGSDDVFDYTVIGDAVNLGSRIEGLNKVYGSEVLVSDATVAAAGGGFLFRELDRVRVKGKSEAVVLCELIAAQPAPPEATAKAERFAAALALYRGRDFAAAEAAFGALAAAGDGPSRLYVERSRRYLSAPPPADWDGVETFTSK